MSSGAFIGVWRDFSYSQPALQYRITVTTNNGNLLVTALGLIIACAESGVWAIFCFAVHQYRTHWWDCDALDRQHAVILRNESSPSNASWTFLRTAWAWHGKSKWALTKGLSYALASLIIFLAVQVTALYVAVQPVLGPNPTSPTLVRLNSGDCGFVNFTAHASEGNNPYYYAWKTANDTQASRVYVRNCYDAPAGQPGCSIYKSQSLPYSNSTTEPCPFQGEKRCVTGPSGAFSVDTGYIDSHNDLGINARSEDRIQFRLKNTCAVLDYGDVRKYYVSPTGLAYQEFSLGLSSGPGSLNHVYPNVTYLYQQNNTSGYVGYTVQSVVNGEYFAPSPDFARDDALVSFHFFAPNSIFYTGSVSDPFFKATNQGSDGLYGPDSFVHIMGCMDQLEVCNPNDGMCSGLTATNNFTILGWNWSPNQLAALERVLYAVQYSNTYAIVSGQNNNAMLANDAVWNFVSPPVPDNQWQAEITGWFKTTLANVQQLTTQYITNDWVAYGNPNMTVKTPLDFNDSTGSALEAQCHDTLVLSTDEYQTFSLLGVVLIPVFAIFLNALGALLPAVVEILPVYKRKLHQDSAHKWLQWHQDGALFLLRQVLEFNGFGNWHSKLRGIPYRDKHVDKKIVGAIRVTDPPEQRIYYDYRNATVGFSTSNGPYGPISTRAPPASVQHQGTTAHQSGDVRQQDYQLQILPGHARSDTTPAPTFPHTPIPTSTQYDPPVGSPSHGHSPEFVSTQNLVVPGRSYHSTGVDVSEEVNGRQRPTHQRASSGHSVGGAHSMHSDGSEQRLLDEVDRQGRE